MSLKRVITGGRKMDVTKVDLSLKGIVMLAIAFAVLIGAYGGGKWLYGKGKGVVHAFAPQTAGTSSFEEKLGL